MKRTLEASGLFVASLLLFIWPVPGQEVTGFDSRFYLFALEMWQNGPSWFPTAYLKPYPDYTAASTFVIYCIALLAGGMSKLVAVLPSAIAASLTVVFTYLTGALQSRRWGLIAVSMLLLTIGFLNAASSISLDMYVVLFTTVCFYLVYSSDIKVRHAPWFMLSILFILGFIFRGPIGLVIPTGVVCTYYLLTRQYRYFFIMGFLSLVYLLAGVSLLFMLAYLVGGSEFLQNVITMQVVARMGEDAQPVYYYLSRGLTTYAIGFPLAWMTMAGLLAWQIKGRQLEKHETLWALVVWMLVIVVGMSIPGEKKIRYILPAMPACALLAAYPLVFIRAKGWFNVLRKSIVALLLYMPVLLIVFLTVMLVYADKYDVAIDLPYISLYVTFALLQLINIAFFYRFYTSPQKSVFIAMIAALAFVAFSHLAIEPVTMYVERAHELVVAVEKQRQQIKASLVFYQLPQDGLPIKYMINMPHREYPVFIDNMAQLRKLPAPAVVIMRKKTFIRQQQAISKTFELLASDRLGHVAVVILKSKGNG